MTRLLQILAAAMLASTTGCACMPDLRYVPAPPPVFGPGAYAEVSPTMPVDHPRPQAPEGITFAIAGARAAEGGVYIDVVVQSTEPAAPVDGADDTWRAAAWLSAEWRFGGKRGREVLRLRDSAGRDVAVHPGEITASRPSPLCWGVIPHTPAMDWVSRLDSDDGARYAATIRLATDHPVSLGPATLLPPDDPAADVEGALHRILRLGAEGAVIEVRETDWMAWQPAEARDELARR